MAIVARSTAQHLRHAAGTRPSELVTTWQVDYALDGSVRADGTRVRVAAWLIDTRGETQVWADAVDGRLRRPLSLQVDMATRLAHSLVESSRERFPAVAS
jgi:TolB-like protein